VLLRPRAQLLAEAELRGVDDPQRRGPQPRGERLRGERRAAVAVAAAAAVGRGGRARERDGRAEASEDERLAEGKETEACGLIRGNSWSW